MFYIAVYVVLVLTAFARRERPYATKHVYWIFFVLLFVLCAFRYEVGCDWFGYMNQFYYGQAFELTDATSRIRDPLWWVYVGFVNRLGLSYPWLNVGATAVMFAGLHVLATRQPDRLAFLVLLFPVLIVHIGMSGIRQAAAIGVVCIALTAFMDRRLIRFVLLILLASTVHSSAMIFLLLAPLVVGRYSARRVVLAALLAVPGILIMLSSSAAELAISRYIDTGIDAVGAIFRVGLLLLTGLIFLALLRRPWQKTEMPDYSLVSIGSLGMIALVALLPVSTVIADRLGYYFVPIQAIILARIPFLNIGSRTLLTFMSYAILGLTLLVWVIMSSHYDNCYTPYQTWLIGMPSSRFGL